MSRSATLSSVFAIAAEKVLIAVGRYETAERMIRRRSDASPAAKGACLLQIGALYEQRQDLQRAEDLYREAMALDPADPLPLVKLGYLEELRNRPALAIASYKAALDLMSDGPGVDFKEKLADRLRKCEAHVAQQKS